MKRNASRLLALILAAVLALSACGNTGTDSNKGATDAGKGSETTAPGETTAKDDAAGDTKAPAPAASGESIEDFYTFEVSNRELEGFFYLKSELAQDHNVMTNAISSLVATNGSGQLVPEIAESWGTEDNGLTWTFKLREGVKWVDVNGNEMADCTAQDWITALEWVLNFHKNESNNTSMPLATIKGAQEYYDYTKELSKDEGLALDTTKFLEMVGIAAPDDHTVVYTCSYECPYFDTVATSASLLPISQALIDSIGVENMAGISNEQLWYNGPYTVTSFIQGNEKVLTKNPLYWDTNCTLFNTVTIKIVDDTTMSYQLFENGEIDCTDLSEAALRQIYDDENHPFHDNLVEKLPRKYSYQMHLNYNKMKEDGKPDDNWNKAVANENFRLAMYYGLDLNNYWSRTNFIYPEHCENLAYTMKGLVYLSDGTEYTELVKPLLNDVAKDENGAYHRFNAEKGASYKEAAKKELEAAGVTFPVEIDYYIISGSQNALDTATVLQQIFSQCLGDDFVKLNIKTYVSSIQKEVVQPKLHSFIINGWGADYGDIQNFLGQETYGEDSAYYSNNYSNINDATDEKLIDTYKEFTELVNKADAITDDLDARYKAYAEAEAFMLNHALVIPAQYEVSWQLTKTNDYSHSNALYGIQNYTYKNWETSVAAYTTEQYKAFAEAAGY